MLCQWLSIAAWVYIDGMETYTNLYAKLCSSDNLELAWRKARKRKTMKDYVMNFEDNLNENLTNLKNELETFTYSPAALKTFIVRDPKIRKISASHFRDRVVHHAICNIIEPIFQKSFIYDSFANQKGKGTHSAIRRQEHFIRRAHIVTNVAGGGATAFEGEGKCWIRSEV